MAKEVDFSLGRKDILRGFNSFQNVFEKQKSLGSDYFVIYFHKEEVYKEEVHRTSDSNNDIKSPSGSKAGFIVSKKNRSEGEENNTSPRSKAEEIKPSPRSQAEEIKPTPRSQAPAWERREIKTGFIVSKKKVRKSVNRNKLKRYLRELYRMNKPEAKGNEYLSLIVSFTDAAIAEFSKAKKLDIKKMNSEFKNLITKVVS